MKLTPIDQAVRMVPDFLKPSFLTFSPTKVELEPVIPRMMAFGLIAYLTWKKNKIVSYTAAALSVTELSYVMGLSHFPR